MMQVISALKGFAIDATDGGFGTVVDFLFDEVSWKVRWLVVDCGTWRDGHKVLIHPSAVSSIDFEDECFEVNLTKAQIEASPDEFEDLPVSRQAEMRLFEHYGWDPAWSGSNVLSASGAMASPWMTPPYFGFGSTENPIDEATVAEDSHLRSFEEIVGYRIHARDGEIGHIENFMLDGSSWSLRFLIVDTSNWWFGARVLIVPSSVTNIDWSDRRIHVDASLDDIKTSPVWDPLVAFTEIEAKRLLHHYNSSGITPKLN
jgi:hypothetical protein